MRAYRIEITAVLNDFELKLFNPMSFVEATTDLCNTSTRVCHMFKTVSQFLQFKHSWSMTLSRAYSRYRPVHLVYLEIQCRKKHPHTYLSCKGSFKQDTFWQRAAPRWATHPVSANSSKRGWILIFLAEIFSKKQSKNGMLSIFFSNWLRSTFYAESSKQLILRAKNLVVIFARRRHFMLSFI